MLKGIEGVNEVRSYAISLSNEIKAYCMNQFAETITDVNSLIENLKK